MPLSIRRFPSSGGTGSSTSGSGMIS